MTINFFVRFLLLFVKQFTFSPILCSGTVSSGAKSHWLIICVHFFHNIYLVSVQKWNLYNVRSKNIWNKKILTNQTPKWWRRSGDTLKKKFHTYFRPESVLMGTQNKNVYTCDCIERERAQPHENVERIQNWRLSRCFCAKEQ